MISPDSEIADFYPTDFYVDLIGKKFDWLGEVLGKWDGKSCLFTALSIFLDFHNRWFSLSSRRIDYWKHRRSLSICWATKRGRGTQFLTCWYSSTKPVIISYRKEILKKSFGKRSINSQEHFMELRSTLSTHQLDCLMLVLTSNALITIKSSARKLFSLTLNDTTSIS